MQSEGFLKTEKLKEWMALNPYLSFSKRSLKAAELQIERIWSFPESRPAGLFEMAEANELKLIDIHFFFVAMRNIHRFLEKAVAGDRAYDELRAKFELLNNKWFKHYSKAREAFEHIDQRLPGEKYEDRIVQVENRKIHYGIEWKGATFRHSDQTWDISQQTFELFKSDVSKLIDELANYSSQFSASDA